MKMVLVYFVLQNGVPVSNTNVLETVNEQTCKFEQHVVDVTNDVNRRYNTGREYVAWCEPSAAYQH